jgi:putative oxidoreductase
VNNTSADELPGVLGGAVAKVIGWLEAIPFSFIALVARAATFVVFWRSGSVKLDDWAGTLSLFENEYKVPLIPPHIAAYMSAGLELGGSVLILAGLATRAVTMAFLGMICVIQIFIYPEAWPTHIQWVAFLLILLARGPGAISLDALICRLLRRG